MKEIKSSKRLKINGLKQNTFSGKSMRNATESAKYLAYDVTSDLFPEINDIRLQTMDLNSDYNSIKQDIKDKSKEYYSQSKKYFNDIRKNAKSQIKSGKWYKRSGDFDDDFDLDFGYDDDDFSYSSSSDKGVVNAISGSIKMNKKSAALQLSSLNAINENMASLVDFNRTTMNTMAEQSAKYYADSMTVLTEIRDSIRGTQQSQQLLRDESDYEKVLGSQFMNFKEYGKVMYKNINELFASTMGMDFETLSVLGDAGSDMVGSQLKDFVANPIGATMKYFVKDVLIPSTFKEDIDRVRNTFSDFTKSLVNKVGSWSEEFTMEEGGLGSFKNILGQIFKINKPNLKNVNLAGYRKEGAVPFDSLTRKSIIEVIPGYLSKILSALTGSDDVLFDYRKGKFVNRQTAKKEYDDELKSVTNSSFWKISHDFQKKFDGAIDTEQFNEMLYNLIDGGSIPLFNEKMQEKVLKKFGKNKELAKTFLSFLENDVDDITRLSIDGLLNDSLTSRENFIREKQTNLEDITSQLYNFDGVEIGQFGGFKKKSTKKSKTKTTSGKGISSESNNDDIVKFLMERNANGEQINLGYISSLVDGDAERAKEIYGTYQEKTGDKKNIMKNAFGKTRDGIFGKLFAKSDSVFAKINENIFKTAESFLHDIIFGKRDREKEKSGNSFKEKMNGFFNDINKGFENLFASIKDFFDNLGMDKFRDSITSGIHNFLSSSFTKIRGVKGDNGFYSGGKLSGVLNKGKDFINSSIHKFTGREYTMSDGTVVGANSTAPIASFIEKVNTKLFGEGYKKRSGRDKITGGGLIGEFVSSTRQNFHKLSIQLFGSQENIDLVKEKVTKSVPSMKSMAGGAGIGLLASMFLPGGPITGALLGGAAGLANRSKKLGELIFKENAEETLLKSTKAFFNKKFKDWNFDLKSAATFGILGSMLMPGGPIISGAVGAASAFAGGKYKDDLKSRFTEYLFGKGDKEKGKKRGLLLRLQDQISHAIVDPFKMFAIDQGTKIKGWFKQKALLPISKSLTMIGRDIYLTGKDIFKNTFGKIGQSISKAFGTQINKFIAPLRFLGGLLFKSIKNVAGGLLSAPIKALEFFGKLSERRNIKRGDTWTAEQSIKFSEKKQQYEDEYEQDILNANAKIKDIKKRRGETFDDIRGDRETNKKVKEINKAFKKASKGKLTEEQQAEIDAINDKYANLIKGKDGILYEAQRNKETRKKLEEFKALRLQEVVKKYGLDDENSELGHLKKSKSDIGKYIRKALGLPEDIALTDEERQAKINELDMQSELQSGVIDATREQVSILEEKMKQDDEQIKVINEQIKIEQQTIETMKSLKATLESLAGKDGKLTNDEEELYRDTEEELSKLGDITDHENNLSDFIKKRKKIKDAKKQTKKETQELQKDIERAKKEKDRLEGEKKAISNGNGRGLSLPKFNPSNFFKGRRVGRGEEAVQVSTTKVTPTSDPRKGEGGFEEGSTDEYNYKKQQEEAKAHDNAMFSSVKDIGNTVTEQFKWMKDQAQKASMWKMLKFIGKGVMSVAGFLGGKVLDLLGKIPVIGTAISKVKDFFTGGGLVSKLSGLFSKNKSAVMNVKAGIVNVNGGSGDSDFDFDLDRDGKSSKGKKGKTKKKSLLSKATDRFKNSKLGKSKLGQKVIKAGSAVKNTRVGNVVGKVGKTLSKSKVGAKTVGTIAKVGSKVVKLIPAIGTAGAAIASAPAWAVAAGTAALAGSAYLGVKGYKKYKAKKEAEKQEQQLTGNGSRRNNFLNFNGSGNKSIAAMAMEQAKSPFMSKIDNIKNAREQRLNFIKSIFEMGTNIAEIKDVVKDIADLSGASIQMTAASSSASTSSVDSSGDGTSTTTTTTTSKPKFSLLKPSTWKYLGRGGGFAYNNGRGEANGYAYYNQNDSRWSNYSMDTGEGDTLGSAGCGPTAMAMAINSMGGNVSPTDAARYAVEGGYKVPNEGVDASFISDYANANGLGYQARYVDNYAQNDIDLSLASGQPVIALGSTGRGRRNGRGTPFTDSGHYVMITGKDANGNYMVNDPLDSRNNNKRFSASDLLGHTNSYWVDGNIDGSQVDMTGMYGRGDEKVRMFDKVVQYARSFLGKLTYSQPKREAINNNGSTSDCSSFARHVMRTVAGIDPGSYTGAQIGYGTNVGFENAQPGDLVFFGKTGHTGGHGKTGVSHVGIVSDTNGNMIDIGSTPGAKERSYNSNYWKPKQLQVRRVLTNPNELVDPTLPNANKITGFVKATNTGQPDVSGGGAAVTGTTTDGTTTGTSGGSSSSSGNILSDILGEVSSMFTATMFGKEYVPGGSNSADSSGGDGGSSSSSSGYSNAGDDTIGLLLKDRANLSNKFEVGEQRMRDGSGPGFISSGQGDAGGRSYGLPQFTKGGSLQSFVKKLGSWKPEWASQLNAHSVGSTGFNNVWQNIGKSHSEEFGKLQNQQASDTFYTPAANHLRSNYNFDPDKRSLALQSEIHSTAVQYGSLNKIMKAKSLSGKNFSNMSDTEFTDALLDAKLASVGTTHFKGCSGNVQNGVRKRFTQEKGLVRQMYEKEQTLKGNGSSATTLTGAGRLTGRGNTITTVKANKTADTTKNLKTISNVKAMTSSTSLDFNKVIELLVEIRDANVQTASNTSTIASKDFKVELVSNDTINNSYSDNSGDIKVNNDIKADTNPFLNMASSGSQNFSSYDSMRDSINRIATGL